MPAPKAEILARTCHPLHPKGFNKNAEIPYGVTVADIKKAMDEFLDFLTFLNTQLGTRDMPRLEGFLMSANFSSIVGEFMGASLPKHSKTVVKNTYHNGHPDLLPKGCHENDSCQHGEEGIEIKGSRYLKSWQGHNVEDCWLMVFVFDANRAKDEGEGVTPRPFRFVKVVGAQLTKADWKFAGRSEESRRTITASVLDSGYAKMEVNWIYRDMDLMHNTDTLKDIEDGVLVVPKAQSGPSQKAKPAAPKDDQSGLFPAKESEA
ncbi:MAG: hypothetical protein Q8L55_12320 [Phycisphaerales bacterium]|nr:hypothetical protein [Phycisphaerales bacterium]